MPVRPDVGDDIEFLDDPALPVLTDEALDLVDTEIDDELVPTPVPSLAEQRTDRWFLRDRASAVRGEAA